MAYLFTVTGKSANDFLTLIPHLTQAVLMAGSMHLRPLRIEKMDRNTGNA
jgi:hypothetical protein